MIFTLMHSLCCLCVCHLLYNLTFHALKTSIIHLLTQLCWSGAHYFDRSYIRIQHSLTVFDVIRRQLHYLVKLGVNLLIFQWNWYFFLREGHHCHHHHITEILHFSTGNAICYS